MRIVVKVGTSTLTAGRNKLHLPQISELVRQMDALMQEGHQICLVSSGAIAAGREALDFPDLPKTIPGKQMLAAVGQPKLMNIYEQLFHIYGRKVAQILLTREDIRDRKRYLNARNTIESLLNHKAVPIINENDSIATEEICIGDNDNLSALVANFIEADVLVLLTDQDGLFSENPNKNRGAELIEQISADPIPRAVWDAAGNSENGLGTGGMATKLQAADTARQSGTRVVIAHGEKSNVLVRIVNGEAIGTTISALENKMESRKRFMIAGENPQSKVTIDQGAARAIRAGGSLLSVGIIDVAGQFERGDIITVFNPDGKRCAIGVVNYCAVNLAKICGKQSHQIEKILGFWYGDEAIHHDNMVIV